MILTQQVNFQGNTPIDKEFDEICRIHPVCEGCPLLNGTIKIRENIISCITGQMKGKERNDG